MDTVSLLQTPVRSRKDVIRVLQQARQLARLLGFSTIEQAEIGCQAFALALEVAARKTGEAVCFDLRPGALLVGSCPARKNENIDMGPATCRFSMSLPVAAEISREDFVWIIAQLQVLLKVDVLDVMKQQSEDLLGMLHALRCCQNDLDQLRRAAKHSAA